MERRGLPLPRRHADYEEEDQVDISRDDSEDFTTEDTAFFRPAQPDTLLDSDADLLSPIPSPTPLAGRVWSTHSLYGEALVQSSRPLSTGNNTISTSEEDDRILGPQQPFISEQDDYSRTFEDLLVSPSSPVSDTPTTPPSVAPRPALSPPPLILPPEITEEETGAMASAVSSSSQPPATNAAATSSLVPPPPPDTMSYSSKTPLRPPRVPGNQIRHAAASTPASQNNNSGHRRNHRRDGSDTSLMSALTEASFGSVQTAPPPPRNLPLPLLSSSSSWTRYTSGAVTNQLPVLENVVSGMNISVPKSLQQPVLGDDAMDEPSAPPVSSTNASGIKGTGTPIARHSTPPRHRPPQGKATPKNSSVRGSAQPQGGVPRTSSSKNVTQSPSIRHHLQPQQRPSRGNLEPSSMVGRGSTFVPIQKRTRSFSSDAAGEKRASPLTTKQRSLSSDLSLRPEKSFTKETPLLPMMVPSLYSWKASRRGTIADSSESSEHDSIHLQEWVSQVFPQIELTKRGTSNYGWALLMLGMRYNSDYKPGAENLPLRKIQSAASTITEFSLFSSASPPETTKSKTSAEIPKRETAERIRNQWGVAVTLVPILLGCGAALHSASDTTFVLAWLALSYAALLYLSFIFTARCWLGFAEKSEPSFSYLSDDVFFFLVLTRGWPGSLLLFSMLGMALSTLLGTLCHVGGGSLAPFNQLSLVSLILGVSETARRYAIGNVMQEALYRRFAGKFQTILQRICVIRSFARFARTPSKDTSAIVHIDCEEYSRDQTFHAKERIAFEKIYDFLHSNRPLSFEFGPSGSTKERLDSSAMLYDAMAIQGHLPLSVLQETTARNPVFPTLIQEMFPSGPDDTVSQRDFCAAIESLSWHIDTLLSSVQIERSMFNTIETVLTVATGSLALCICIGSSAAKLTASFLALSVSLLFSKWLEASLFSLWTRPFTTGDAIQLTASNGSNGSFEYHDTWLVQRVGFWWTTMKGPGSRMKTTVMSNARLAQRQILTTFDHVSPAMVVLSFHFPTGVSVDKLVEFRKSLQKYVKERGKEWIDVVAMEPVGVSKGGTEYAISLRHRRPVGEFESIRASKMNVQLFINHVSKQLGMTSDFRRTFSTGLKDLSTTYDDELSQYSVTESDNALYFLVGSTQ